MDTGLIFVFVVEVLRVEEEVWICGADEEGETLLLDMLLYEVGDVEYGREVLLLLYEVGEEE